MLLGKVQYMYLGEEAYLEACKDALVLGSIASGTKVQYARGWAHWVLFCVLRGWPALPPGEGELARFMA